MLYVAVLCALAAATSSRAAIINLESDKEKVANKSYDLEEVIKQRLRKDNDDYVLGEDVSLSPLFPERRFEGEHSRLVPTSPPVPDFPTMPFSSNMHTGSFDPTIYDSAPNVPNFRSYENPDGRGPVRRGKDYRAGEGRDENAQVLDGNSRGKWKNLVDKNKRLFIYTSTTRISPSVIMRTVRPSPVSRTHPKREPESDANGEGAQDEREIKWDQDMLKASIAALARTRHDMFRPGRTTPPPDRMPPNADQLDMAPARGAYIHDLRVKNRFCHRHVLWPEGPKYDSKGNVIMPAFNNKKYGQGKRFADTTKPLFVLPKCCNCCKKSVLGCQ